MEKGKIKVLCITRKYPPSVGGMENLCYYVFNGLKCENVDTKIVAMGKKQINLIWFFPYTILYVLLFAHKYDCLLLGDSLLCFLGNVCHTISKKTKRIVIVHGLDYTFSNKLYQLYLRLFYRKSADEYICNSRETQKNLKEWGISYSKVITPGINVDKFDSVSVDKDKFKKAQNIPSDHYVLITVGRLVKRKGVLWFLDRVMPLLKDKPITYVIIGKGPDKESIEIKIKEKHLEEQVRLLGEVSDQTLFDYYCNADLFIMPNISVPGDIEGFGIVALEASLAKLIVVASSIDGITDAIIDQKNGFMLESQSEERYVDKITHIISDYEKYHNKAEEFAEYTKAHYSWEHICSQYLEVIFKLLEVE